MMPLDLNNLLNSTPVSPPHSNQHQRNNQPSFNHLSTAFLKNKVETQSEYLDKIPISPAFSFNLQSPYNHNQFGNRIQKQIYQKPISITSYSFDHNRHIQCGDQQFKSLRPLLDHVSHTGFDLNYGFDQAIFQDQYRDEGLDSLLISLVDFIDRSDPSKYLDHARGLLSAKLITWRGVMTKLCSSVYETGGSNRDSSWALNVMIINGIMYIEEGSRNDITKDIQGKGRPTYYGYSYESLMTNETFEPVNTNQQWVSVVKSNLNGIRMILGGEVDAINQNSFQIISQNPHNYINNKNIDPDNFIEIKTSINPVTERDYWSLHRFKLLKFWLQSFLLGTPRIHVGFRDQQGILCGTTEYETPKIPNIVQNFGQRGAQWASNLCLENGTRIIQMISRKFQSYLNQDQHEEIKKKNQGENVEEYHEKNYTNRLKYFQDRFDSIVMEEFEYQKGIGKQNMIDEEISFNCKERCNELINWPVYKLIFKPRNNNSSNNNNHNSIELIELNSNQVKESVLKFKSKTFNINNTHSTLLNSLNLFNQSHPNLNSRVGFLPSFWLHYLIKLQINLLFEKSSFMN